jgi:hypothetical protein
MFGSSRYGLSPAIAGSSLGIGHAIVTVQLPAEPDSDLVTTGDGQVVIVAGKFVNEHAGVAPEAPGRLVLMKRQASWHAACGLACPASGLSLAAPAVAAASATSRSRRRFSRMLLRSTTTAAVNKSERTTSA